MSTKRRYKYGMLSKGPEAGTCAAALLRARGLVLGALSSRFEILVTGRHTIEIRHGALDLYIVCS